MCFGCGVIRQLFINSLLWMDKTGNTLLLGNPNETISRRTARARLAGHRWAAVACRVLALFLGRDHCEYALQPGTDATEIWAWSDNFSQPELRSTDAP